MGPTAFWFLITIVALFCSLIFGLGLYAGFDGATLGFLVCAAPGFLGLCAALTFAYKESKRKSVVTIVACLWLSIVIGIVLFCGGHIRIKSTPEKALFGHWVTERGTHYYFQDGSYGNYVTINKGDDKYEWDTPYKVIDSNDEENWIKIDIAEMQSHSLSNWIFHQESMLLKYDGDRNTITQYDEQRSGDVKWTYLGTMQRPSQLF